MKLRAAAGRDVDLRRAAEWLSNVYLAGTARSG
jgi:hypothetical protein